MSSLSDRPDLRQLRVQAKELKRAAEMGDRSALDRILTSHPKFAGRPAERLDEWKISLRDAQVTLARELGFESWSELVAQFENSEEKRWNPDRSREIQSRAFREARKNRQRFCTGEHFLLALLSAPEPTGAASILSELGLTYERVAERVNAMGQEPEDHDGSSSTPVYQLIIGMAQGIALGLGAKQVSDEHVLIAMLYGDPLRDSLLVEFDIDPDDVLAGLKTRGIRVPDATPPVSPTPPMGPLGPWVYFPEEEFREITQEIVKHYPPGRAHWGTNRSKWKPKHWYVHGEDEIPMEQIVKSVVKDPTMVEVLNYADGLERESARAPVLVDDE